MLLSLNEMIKTCLCLINNIVTKQDAPIRNITVPDNRSISNDERQIVIAWTSSFTAKLTTIINLSDRASSQLQSFSNKSFMIVLLSIRWIFVSVDITDVRICPHFKHLSFTFSLSLCFIFPWKDKYPFSSLILLVFVAKECSSISPECFFRFTTCSSTSSVLITQWSYLCCRLMMHLKGELQPMGIQQRVL